MNDSPNKWSMIPFSQCVDATKFNVGKVKTKDYLKEGTYPIIDQSKTFISGFTEEYDKLYDGKLPTIVYGDHTNEVKYIDFRFVCGADGTKIITPISDFDAKFFFRAIERFRPKSKGYRRHYSLLKKVKIPLPPISVQRRIVAKLDALFECIDESIVLVEQNIAQATNLLASALNETFEREIDSKHRPLSEALTLFNGRAYKRNELLEQGKYKVVRIQNLKGGEDWFFSDLELGDEKYCHSGDLLYSWSGTPGTSFGAFIWNREKAIYHYHIWRIEFKKKLHLKFAYYQLKYITNLAIENSHGGTGMMHITKAKMEKMPFRVPDYSLQEKISNKLSECEEAVTQLISAEYAKLANLKALKASLLDSAFRGEL